MTLDAPATIREFVAASRQTEDWGEARVVRRARRKQIVWPGRTTPSYLLTPDLRGPLEVMLDVLEPGGQTEEDEPCMNAPDQ